MDSHGPGTLLSVSLFVSCSNVFMYGADSVMDTTVCIIVFVSCSNVFTDVWDNVDIFTIIYLCQL